MRHATQDRRVHRHHLMLHRPPRPGSARPGQIHAGHEPARLSDLILALIGVAMLGGLALATAASLGARALGS